MKRATRFAVLATALLALSQAATATVMNVRGVYDENTYASNVVDASLTPYTVAQFTADVAAAYAAGRGGVIGFEDVGPNNYNNYIITDGVMSATVGARTLTIGVPTSAGVAYGLGSASPISGDAKVGGGTILGALGGAGGDDAGSVNDLNFVFGIPTGGNAADRVTSVGLTYIGRSSITGNTVITATYSGGGTSVLTTDGNQTGGERFAGFTAPAGQYITSLLVDSPTANRRVFIDDLGFVISPIPEPASLALVGAAGLLLMRRRG